MYADRLPLYRQLEAERGSKVIAFITGDRPGLETQIHPEVLDFFVHHLDRIGVVERISLYLYTCGGHTLGAWSIVNLLRQFCEALEVIVPAKALSSGTLICLGADTIVMTKQATLGPIDPSINGPLNPQVAGLAPAATVPVSVEAVNGYIEFARAALGDNDRGMIAVLERLYGQIHPLVLGGAYRSRTQIRMLAKRLIGRQIKDEAQVVRVLNFLCSDSGSHDYTIYRREARDELGLCVEAPGDTGYRLIQAVHADIRKELELAAPFDRQATIGRHATVPYCLRRVCSRALMAAAMCISCGAVCRGDSSSHNRVSSRRFSRMNEHSRDGVMTYERGSSSKFLVFPRYGEGGSTSAPKPVTSSACPDNLAARMRNAITVFRNGRDVQIAVNQPWRMEEPGEEEITLEEEMRAAREEGRGADRRP